MRDSSVHRGTTALLALGLIFADVPTALAREPVPSRFAGTASYPTLQLAGGTSRRNRVSVDPETRKLRQTRGLLAGGIVLTALCGAGFGLSTYAAVHAGDRLHGLRGDNIIKMLGVSLACTVLAIGAVGASARRLHTLRGARRVAWTGGLGLRF